MERLLLIGSDLPCLDSQYLRTIDEEMDLLIKENGRGVVLNPSRRLGCATIYLAPPMVYKVTLGVGRRNLLTQRFLLEYQHIPYKVLGLNSGYFDVDLPEDLYETYYLLLEVSHTKGLLQAAKWDFILPSNAEREPVSRSFVSLLRTESQEELEGYLGAGVVIGTDVIHIAAFRNQTACIFVTTPELAFELLEELRLGMPLHSVSLTMRKAARFPFGGKEYELRIGAYGVPCDEVEAAIRHAPA